MEKREIERWQKEARLTDKSPIKNLSRVSISLPNTSSEGPSTPSHILSNYREALQNKTRTSFGDGGTITYSKASDEGGSKPLNNPVHYSQIPEPRQEYLLDTGSSGTRFLDSVSERSAVRNATCLVKHTMYKRVKDTQVTISLRCLYWKYIFI